MIIAAGIESFFIFLLIAGASAFFNWLQKKGKGEDGTSVPPPDYPREMKRPVKRPSPSPQTNWQEELRRLLEGNLPKTPPQSPPPIGLPQRRETSPPRLEPRTLEETNQPTMSLSPVFSQEKFYKAHCNYCEGHIEFPASAMEQVISCPHCHRPTVLRPFGQNAVEAVAHQNVLTNFAEADRQYEQASQLSQRVAAHMHGVGHRPVGTTSIERRKRSTPSIDSSLAQFRNARTVRQAMIASFILGPPKALES